MSDAHTPSDAESVRAQLRGWATLGTLRPSPIDLSRVARVCEGEAADWLASDQAAAQLVMELGLNPEGVKEFPQALHAHFGGLRIWQYPHQFGPYLRHLAGLGVRSYVEIGVRHGGSFVATVEVLQRVAPLDCALAVDILPAPALERYAHDNPAVQLAWMDSRSEKFRARLAELGPFDLAFVDSHHEEPQCRAEVELLSRHARYVALHDVTNVGCPGVGRVWRDLCDSPRYRCIEFAAQYPGFGPFMGIGLAECLEGSRDEF